MRRILAITVGLVGIGAAVGGTCAVLAVIAQMLIDSPHDAIFEFEPSALFLRIAGAGAVIGGIAAPVMAFGFLRTIPIGIATAVGAVGAVVGALIGEWIAPFNPYDMDWSPGIVRGALLGFIISEVFLRLAYRDRRSILSTQPYNER